LCNPRTVGSTKTPSIEDWHTYGFDWNKDRIVWSVDGVVSRQLKRSKPCDWQYHRQPPDSALASARTLTGQTKDGKYYPTRPGALGISLWDASSPVGTLLAFASTTEYNPDARVNPGGFHFQALRTGPRVRSPGRTSRMGESGPRSGVWTSVVRSRSVVVDPAYLFSFIGVHSLSGLVCHSTLGAHVITHLPFINALTPVTPPAKDCSGCSRGRHQKAQDARRRKVETPPEGSQGLLAIVEQSCLHTSTTSRLASKMTKVSSLQ
jgi:hypothetical protein